jgi:hypothetical protein
LPTKALITPRRYDLAIKWRFFRHLLEGGDEDSARVYLWHIAARSGKRMEAGLTTDAWKRSLDDYVASAGALCRSMAYRGFDPSCAVPIDLDGELLNGSHRVSCALALGIADIAVKREKRYIFAPRWDYEWFASNGMAEEDLERLQADWQALAAR